MQYSKEFKDNLDIKSRNKAELTLLMEEMGEKAFRAGQVYEWIHGKQARSYEEMSNLSKELRLRLDQQWPLYGVRPVRVQESAIDGTRKYLFALEDGMLIESVWMKYHHGNSVCISSQVGCRMGCKFCASTLDGLGRNLRASEMLDQIYYITGDTGERVSNVVVMGMGEPLDNYENLLRFLELLTDENGLHISQRNVTVSTCGLADRIRELAGEDLQITLAISLHAATDERRRRIMPIANRYSIRELMAACREYYQKTGRRLTFEYSLIAGVNDSQEDAELLAGLARPLGAHVNLIPVNPVRERGMAAPERRKVVEFQKKLEKNGINGTIRRELGRDIDGACGQLRRRQLSGE